MFWRFGGYANISTIDSILDKPDISLEEVLEESDLIQELKQHNSKLIEYLRDDAILQRLLEYVVAPPIVAPEADDEEDEADESPTTKKTFSPVRSLSIGRGRSEKSKQQEEREAREKEEKTRQKHAYVACEILASETWSILEALLENQAALKKLWEFVRREAPLDPVTAGYFTKVNETLIDKKTEEMLAFFKSLEDIVPAMLQHVDCPMVMDLLLKIISMEKAEGGQGIVDVCIPCGVRDRGANALQWLQSQNLISLLLGFLGPEHPTFTQTSAGDFIKAIITISANASQNEQSCIGPNSLTRQLVSETCVERMITDMLRGGNPLTVGVGIIIEVIRKNNSDYDPEITAGQEMPPTTNDPIYLGTLLRNFARHVPDFMALLLSPNHTISDGTKTRTEPRPSLAVAFGKEPIEPLGFDRFKTCELMAELLHCSNMGLLNERGSEAYIRQRDKERERLRAEGTLPVQRSPTPREPHSAVTEFSEDESGGLAVEVTGPDAAPGEPSTPPRKLEVTNNAEDDGYEDVGASPEYADDLRDDFDERPGFEIEGEAVPAASPITPSKSRVSLDDEFFDEPLTSPSLLSRTAEPARSPPAENEDDDRPAPLSPTKVANQLHETHLEEKEPEHQEADGEPSSTDALVAEIDSHLSSPATGDEASSPPERKLHLQVRPEGNDPSSPRGLSPHAEDQPAPLFASPEPQSQPETNEPAPEPTIMMLEPTEKPQPNALQNDVLEESHEPQVDPAYAVDQGQDFTAHMETDIDGEPIVGDYLKMVFVEHRVVPTILVRLPPPPQHPPSQVPNLTPPLQDFFFRFPWNNFLHNVVYDVVQQVFNGPMDRGYNRALAIDLFAAGDVTGRIVAGQARSDAAAARTHTRLGYMGHLTLVAEEVVKFAERHPPEVLGEAVVAKVTSDVWAAYVEHTLAATRERDNAILGGVRPDAGGAGAGGALGGGAGGGGIAQISPAFVGAGSSALANAGLNGGGGGREEAGAVGQRLFGAGDSDEEDEEEVEANEEREEGAEEHEQVGNCAFEVIMHDF